MSVGTPCVVMVPQCLDPVYLHIASVLLLALAAVTCVVGQNEKAMPKLKLRGNGHQDHTDIVSLFRRGIYIEGLEA